MNSIWAESKLWQGIVPLSGPSKLYAPTLTSNGQVKIENVFLANIGSAPVTIWLWTGITALDGNVIFPGTEIKGNTLWVPRVVLYLGNGESVWGQASVEAVVCLTLNGGVRQ